MWFFNQSLIYFYLFVPNLEQISSNNTYLKVVKILFLFTKQERWLIFSALKKSCFLKSLLLVNFWIQRYLNFLNLWNISMLLNKSIIQRRYWVGVITSCQFFSSFYSCAVQNIKEKWTIVRYVGPHRASFSTGASFLLEFSWL